MFQFVLIFFALLDCYQNLVNSELPPMPTEWVKTEGWTLYNTQSGKVSPVEFPSCDACIFDSEVLMCEGQFPTLAVAVSHNGW